MSTRYFPKIRGKYFAVATLFLEGVLGMILPRIARKVPHVVKVDGSIIIEPCVSELAVMLLCKVRTLIFSWSASMVGYEHSRGSIIIKPYTFGFPLLATT
jgi:hypothetical protein